MGLQVDHKKDQWAHGFDQRWHVAARGSARALCSGEVDQWNRYDGLDLKQSRKVCSKCIDFVILANRAEGGNDAVD